MTDETADPTRRPPADGAPTRLSDLVRQAATALTRQSDSRHAGGGATTDLSLDEELALHAAGWEPVDLVCGISLFSVPSGIWTWGQGEIGWASNAFMGAFAAASRRIHEDCRRAGGHGVVGVRLERAVHRHHIEVALEGTAVRPVGGGRGGTSAVFLSDLSGRDFSLLEGAGWTPLGLAAGASFVYAPRRSMGTVVRQTSQNVELTNFTEALYAARETAMERMQHAALDLGGTGVVEVKVTEGPVDFASHAVGFAAYGTAVRQRQAEHRPIEPQTAVPLDDTVRGVEATSLRGG